MKIALAHDSFSQLGGAERLIEGLHKIFPGAPVYALVLDKKFASRYKGWKISVSFLQKFYNILPRLKYWLFLIPEAVNSLKFEGFDLVFSTSSGFIKNIRVSKGVIHINYCHTPARFLWSDPSYLSQEVPLVLRYPAKLLLRLIKEWDFKGAQSVSFFIANSKEVQRRIKEYYKRDSVVIYPFINTDFWHSTRHKEDYFLIGGRLQAHKNNDSIIELFNHLNLPLHVVGTGREEQTLRSSASSNIKFLGWLTDEQLRDEYSGAKALIFPQIEDFGLMPLEAAACGTPTIGLAEGGNLETIVLGKTGELFNSADGDLLKNLILNFQTTKYPAEVLRRHAEQFSFEIFKRRVQEFISQKM